ncbi:MAG: major capsid protein P2 [Pseudomonadota bacterium]
MAKKIINLPSISRVVAGSIAILELPIGSTYQFIRFGATGTALAVGMIELIRVIVDGRVIQEYKNLQRLFDSNIYHNRSADTVNDFSLYFRDDDYDQLAAKRTPALGTDGLQTVNIEITLGATFPANGTLVAHALIDTKREQLGVFTRIRETSINSAVAGQIEYDKLVRGGAVYKAIHLWKADISSVILEADGNKIIEAPKAVLERIQKSVRPVARVPVTAKATHIDFCLEGDDGDLLNTAGMNDLRIRMNFDTSGVCEVSTEQLDVWIP